MIVMKMEINKRASREDNMKKYTKKDFLEYASAFDYQNDIDEGNLTGYKTDKEIKDDMKKWKLKDFHTHFGFSHFNKYSGDEKLIANTQKG